MTSIADESAKPVFRTLRYWPADIGDTPDWFDEEFDDLREQVKPSMNA